MMISIKRSIQVGFLSLFVAIVVGVAVTCVFYGDLLIPKFPSEELTLARDIAARNANRIPRWSQDGQTLVVNIDERIFRIDLDGTNLKRIPLQAGRGQFSPSLAPNGHIAYLDTTNQYPAISIMDIDGRQVKELARTQYIGNSWGVPEWSPTGQHIAFSSSQYNYGDGERIGHAAIIDARGREQIVQPSPILSGGQPIWSHDGTLAAFKWGGPTCADRCLISIIDTSGTNVTIPTELKFLTLPSWSPDDRNIYFFAYDTERSASALFVVSISTLRPERIIDLPDTLVYDARLSPDGTSLLFSAAITPAKGLLLTEVGLYIVETDGTNLKKIRTDGFLLKYLDTTNVRASWSPDGTRIALTDSKVLLTIALSNAEVRVLIWRNENGTVVPGRGEPLNQHGKRIDAQ